MSEGRLAGALGRVGLSLVRSEASPGGGRFLAGYVQRRFVFRRG